MAGGTRSSQYGVWCVAPGEQALVKDLSAYGKGAVYLTPLLLEQFLVGFRVGSGDHGREQRGHEAWDGGRGVRDAHQYPGVLGRDVEVVDVKA